MGRRNDDRLGIPLVELEHRRAAQRARLERHRRKAAMEPPGPPIGIGDLRTNEFWVHVFCGRPYCGHCAVVFLTPLIIRWGPHAPIEFLRRAALCSKCGHKGAVVHGSSSAWPTALVPIVELSRWTGREVWPPREIDETLDGYAFGGERYFHPLLGIVSFNDMCNLYSNTRSRDAIRALFRVSDNRAYAFEPMPAIFPKRTAPVVRIASDGERELVPMSWGFPLIRKGFAPKPVTNVRDDTVLTSPFWRPSFEARRCLVPASSYCEPDSNMPAGWHWFALEPADERPLFAFPGVWKRYRGPMKKDGPEVEVDVYAFMTTRPNALTATIMHDRMPVLLSDERDFDTWMAGSVDEAFRLVRTFPAERMRVVQSGSDKEDLLGAPSAQSALL